METLLMFSLDSRGFFLFSDLCLTSCLLFECVNIYVVFLSRTQTSSQKKPLETLDIDIVPCW